jgi:hypothetical protein
VQARDLVTPRASMQLIMDLIYLAKSVKPTDYTCMR